MTCIKSCFASILALFTIFTTCDSFLRCQVHKQGQSASLKHVGGTSKLSLSTGSNKIVEKVMLPLLLSSVLLISSPMVSNAYWNESGEWIELKESSFSEVWGDRLKKASTMSPSDILMAAKGAGNTEKRY